MKPLDSNAWRIHEDPDFFREAVRFTARQSGFSSRLVEKDYFCTVLLQYLSAAEPQLVFKGGTCLSKVHDEFFRMSEDLDFVIPMPLDSTRGERSKKMAVLKPAVSGLTAVLPVFNAVEPLTGANASTQYNAAVRYSSLMDGRSDLVKIEVGLREPLATASARLGARTLLRNPVSGDSLMPELALACLSLREAYAEKCRAALSRQPPAIRDFFDLEHAIRKARFDLNDPAMIELIRAKLEIPGNGPVDLSVKRLAQLRIQLEAELKPVLRAEDFMAFDLDRIFSLLQEMAGKLVPTTSAGLSAKKKS